jgi:hypothetical protein
MRRAKPIHAFSQNTEPMSIAVFTNTTRSPINLPKISQHENALYDTRSNHISATLSLKNAQTQKPANADKAHAPPSTDDCPNAGCMAHIPQKPIETPHITAYHLPPPLPSSDPHETAMSRVLSDPRKPDRGPTSAGSTAALSPHKQPAQLHAVN